jgi:hypothetical protein
MNILEGRCSLARVKKKRVQNKNPSYAAYFLPTSIAFAEILRE